MYSVVIAFGIASVMLCVGMAIRGKVKAVQKILMPTSVIGGIAGLLFMNLILPKISIGELSTTDFSNIVSVFFTMSFISIGLAGDSRKKKKNNESGSGKADAVKAGSDKSADLRASGNKGSISGAFGMGIIWCLLYALTPAIGIIIIYLIGPAFEMNPMYGLLIPFAFCQGPGQSSTYGAMFEQQYGYANAEMVALTFAVIGFLAAFFIGVPLARKGLKKGLASNTSRINAAVERGYYYPEEQRESIGKTTCHSANIETVAVHFMFMGISYLLALVIQKIVMLVPVLGSSMGAMLFMWGLFAAYIVKAVLRKLGIDYLINTRFQSRLTGFFSDYLVVCSFMCIQLSVIGKWIIPIVIESLICAAVTYFICMYFGSRLGSDHDFERVLGLYGTCTGTTPSGISLIRIADPNLTTATGAEMGGMNAAMMASTPVIIIMTFAGLHIMSLPVVTAVFIGLSILYMVILKISRCWNKPTFSMSKGRLIGDTAGSDEAVLVGTLHIDPEDVESAILNSMN